MPTILIGADICPIEANRPYFLKGDAKSLFNDLLVDLQEADLTIANLECPLIEQESPIAKTGPVFGEPSACINGIREAGIDVLCLANNHILDHGSAGLQNTMNVCEQAGIATVGAGPNLAEARKILVREVEGVRVGILAVAEHEFSIAGKNAWGANPLDLIDFVRNVKRHGEDFDYLVVLYHGGDEFHVPSPRTRDTCRFMIEMGADVVVVQHPHCLGGCEDYEGGHIVYGQGALIMDEAIYRNSESFRQGFLIKLSIGSEVPAGFEIVPFLQPKGGIGSSRLVNELQFHQQMEHKSRMLKKDGYVESQWLDFCEKRKHAYLSGLLGHNRVLRKLNSGGHLAKLLYSRKVLLGVRNLVCCETHREVVETLFDQRMS